MDGMAGRSRDKSGKIIHVEMEKKFETLYQDEDYTIVKCIAQVTQRYEQDVDTYTIVGKGISRRSRKDKPNNEIGFNIAKARAERAVEKKCRRKSRALNGWCEV